MEGIESANTPEYTKPEITDHGSLTELTAGSSAGKELDATFTRGTPTSQLTFSGP
jgi:hypothetical protein